MKRFLGVLAVMAGFILSEGLAFNAYSHVQLPPSEVVKASRQDLDDIVSTYGKIEEAVAKEDLDAVMSFYAEDYFHQGITRNMIRNLWASIFNDFDSLNSAHAFSVVAVSGKEAKLTCTGTLLGIPKGSADKKFVAVDKWAAIDHYLSKTDGGWKIAGGASHWLVEPMVKKYGEDVKYQLEFHPLF